MPLATLSIDLEAKLANLEAGMDKAARLAEKNALATEASWKRAGATLAGIGGAVAGLFAGVSLVGLVRSSLDAVDALNDVADATGASIENISALEDLAKRTGTTMDTVTSALVKLNGQLADAKTGSPTAQALSAIGLEADKLRQLDPAEALRVVAVALSGYADDGNKARLVQELFGKSVKEVAPLLKDLAEQQQLVATTTAAQAEAAEKANKQLFAFQANISTATRRISLELLPALNSALEAYSKFGLLDGIVLPALSLDDYSSKARDLEVLQQQVNRAADAVGRLAEEASRSPDDGFLGVRLDKARERLSGLQKQALEASDALKRLTNGGELPGSGDYSNEGRNAPRRSVGNVPGADDGKKRQAEQITEAQRALAAYVAELQKELDKTTELTQQQKTLDLLRSLGATGEVQQVRDLVQGLDRQLTLRRQDIAIREDILRVTKEQEAAEKALADQLYQLSGRADDDRKAALTQALEAQLNSGVDYSPEELNRLVNGIAGITQQAKDDITELDELTKEFARNVQDSLGETIKRTLKGDFDSILDLWGNMLLEMAAQAAAAEIGKELFGADFFKSGQGGGQLGGLFGNLASWWAGTPILPNALGNAFDKGIVTQFANGGIFDSATRFTYAGGQLGEMGEAGPEAVMPLRRGRDGKLGVAAAGGAGPTFVFQIASGVTRPELLSLVPGIKEQIKAELQSMANRPK